MAVNWVPAKVIENRKLTSRHFALILDAELMPFEAGQFARLQVQLKDKDDKGKPIKAAKPYSFINAPGEKYIEVYFDVVPGGQVSNALAALEPGDTLEVAQPCVGFFVLSQVPDVSNLWMLSTGTGIGPYLSMLKTDMPWQRFKHIVLVHAVPQAEELTYQDLINQFKQDHPDQFQYIPVVSREDYENALKGRIPELIEKGSLEKKAGLEINKENSHVMVCGNSGLLKDTKEVLKQRGMARHLNHKPGQISSEQYF